MIVGSNAALQLIFDTPAVRFSGQSLNAQAYAFFPQQVVSNADEGIRAGDTSTKTVIDGTNCEVIQKKLEMRQPVFFTEICRSHPDGRQTPSLVSSSQRSSIRRASA